MLQCLKGIVVALLVVFTFLPVPAYAASSAAIRAYDDVNVQTRNYSGQNLIRAEFSNARLKNANFSNADLQGAVFNGSVLTNAKLTPKQVKIATGAVTLIINKSNVDSLLSKEQLKEIFTVKITHWNQSSLPGNACVQVILAAQGTGAKVVFSKLWWNCVAMRGSMPEAWRCIAPSRRSCAPIRSN